MVENESKGKEVNSEQEPIHEVKAKGLNLDNFLSTLVRANFDGGVVRVDPEDEEDSSDDEVQE